MIKTGSYKFADVPIYRSYRYAIAIVSFFGFMFVYVLRVNFSVAIVCKVKPRNSSFIVHNGTLDVINSTVCGGLEREDTKTASYEGEFEWTTSTRSQLLSAFFYGYVVTQIPGGWLARRFGARRVFAIGMFISSISTILMPVCARASLVLVFALRVVAGLSTGVVSPCAICLFGRWVPPLERSRIPGAVFTGPAFGTVVTMSMSGVMCAHGFDNGWGSIFYISGICTILWLSLWMYFVYDTPSKHPRISTKETAFIAYSIGDSYYEPEKTIATPWRAMMTSQALWAVILTHFCTNWTQYTLITGLPSYMNEALHFDIRTNGLLSAVPYICAVVCGITTTRFADFLREKGYLSTVNTRRLFQSTAFLGLTVFILCAGFVSCEQRMLAVVFLSLAVSLQQFSRSGYLVNHLDFAPRYAGELFGITNTASTIPGMIAPLVNGALTPNGTQEEWRNVFYLCAAVSILGTIIFDVMVKGEIEPWAKPRGVVGCDDTTSPISLELENMTKPC